MERKLAAVLTVGNEILKGKTVNTNASEIARRLTFAGYNINRMLVVSDEASEIGWAFKTLLGTAADLIVSTGGLGPTFDDITVQSFAQEFNLELNLDENVWTTLQNRYTKTGVALTDERKKMAMIPAGGEPLQNDFGAAPGVMIEIDSTKIILLPGVPKEAIGILDSIIERLRVPDVYTVERSRHTKGIMESSLAPIVKRVMGQMGDAVYIKTHPLRSETNQPELEIEIMSVSASQREAESSIEKAFEMISELAKQANLPFK